LEGSEGSGGGDKDAVPNLDPCGSRHTGPPVSLDLKGHQARYR